MFYCLLWIDLLMLKICRWVTTDSLNISREVCKIFAAIFHLESNKVAFQTSDDSHLVASVFHVFARVSAHDEPFYSFRLSVAVFAYVFQCSHCDSTSKQTKDYKIIPSCLCIFIVCLVQCARSSVHMWTTQTHKSFANSETATIFHFFKKVFGAAFCDI